MNKQFRIVLLLTLAGCLIYTLIKVVDTYLMLSAPYIVNPTPDPLEAELSDRISRYEKGEVSVIDLSAVTTFSWDRLYVFGPYTPLSELESTVGKSWRKICFTQIDVLEGYTLLVFTENKKVIHCLEYPVEKYDFSSLASYTSGISIQEAKFILDENKSLIWTKDK